METAGNGNWLPERTMEVSPVAQAHERMGIHGIAADSRRSNVSAAPQDDYRLSALVAEGSRGSGSSNWSRRLTTN